MEQPVINLNWCPVGQTMPPAAALVATLLPDFSATLGLANDDEPRMPRMIGESLSRSQWGN
jgi:hypothetical protein